MGLDADVIIPVTTATDHTYQLAMVALRTCQASTTARVWAVINNSPDSIQRSKLVAQCRMLGIRVIVWPRAFSLTKIFNAGYDNTKGEYIAFGTSDVIYFQNWFENIVDLWREHPEYYCLVNYSFDDAAMPCTKTNAHPERRIHDTHNPSSGVTVFKRSNCFRWDENIILWEMDTDLTYHLKKNNLKAGYCLNARCDHLVACVKDHVPGSAGVGPGTRDLKEYLAEKWNL